MLQNNNLQQSNGRPSKKFVIAIFCLVLVLIVGVLNLIGQPSITTAQPISDSENAKLHQKEQIAKQSVGPTGDTKEEVKAVSGGTATTESVTPDEDAYMRATDKSNLHNNIAAQQEKKEDEDSRKQFMAFSERFLVDNDAVVTRFGRDEFGISFPLFIGLRDFHKLKGSVPTIQYLKDNPKFAGSCEFFVFPQLLLNKHEMNRALNSLQGKTGIVETELTFNVSHQAIRDAARRKLDSLSISSAQIEIVPFKYARFFLRLIPYSGLILFESAKILKIAEIGLFM